MQEVLPKTKRIFSMSLKFRQAMSTFRIIKDRRLGRDCASTNEELHKLSSIVYEIDRTLGDDCPGICTKLRVLTNDVREEAVCYDDPCPSCDDIALSLEERLADVEQEWEETCKRQQSVQKYNDVLASLRGISTAVMLYFAMTVLFFGILFAIGCLVL